MFESLEYAVLAAWSGLSFIPMVGLAAEAVLGRHARRRKLSRHAHTERRGRPVALAGDAEVRS